MERAKMAISTCIKCGGHGFELSLLTPIAEARKLTLVQCSSCGTPVGALDPASGPQIEALRRDVATIDEKLNRIARALQECDSHRTVGLVERRQTACPSPSLSFPIRTPQ